VQKNTAFIELHPKSWTPVLTFGVFSMSKHDEQFKIKAVLEYLSGRLGGLRTVADAHGIDSSTLRMWVASYRMHGALGLRRKGASYTAAFKLSVLERMQRDTLSLRETAALFDIRCATHISRWQRQYDVGGLDALTDRRGRRENMPTKPPAKPPRPVNSPGTEERTLAQLREENEYLRAENAYLKKLDALIQQKRTAAQKKHKS
jgi:transposase